MGKIREALHASGLPVRSLIIEVTETALMHNATKRRVAGAEVVDRNPHPEVLDVAPCLAEGVESTGQMDHLRSEHVDEAQGFLLSRPFDPLNLATQILAPTRPDAKSGQTEPTYHAKPGPATS